MPIKECKTKGRNGYQWGDTGKCYTYADDDNAGKKSALRRAEMQGLAVKHSGYTVSESVKLPLFVVKALSRGLELHSQGLSGPGLQAATVGSATRGVSSGEWSDDKILRASAWLKRHKADRDRMKDPKSWNNPPKYSPAFVAWLLWGDSGDGAGGAWIHKQADKIRVRKKSNERKDEAMRSMINEGDWGMKFVALRHAIGSMLHRYIEKEIVDDDVAAKYIEELGAAIDAAKAMAEHGEEGRVSFYRLMTMVSEMLAAWKEREPETAGGEMYYSLKHIQHHFEDGHRHDHDHEDEEGSEADEAVLDPTEMERSDLPAAAFAPADFFDEDGKFLRSKSKLPHHINTADDPNDNETVDVPRLRNALARFDQTDFSEFGEGVRLETRAHLERHADAILYGADEGKCTTCKKEDIDSLRLELGLFRRGLTDMHLEHFLASTDSQ